MLDTTGENNLGAAVPTADQNAGAEQGYYDESGRRLLTRRQMLGLLGGATGFVLASSVLPVAAQNRVSFPDDEPVPVPGEAPLRYGEILTANPDLKLFFVGDSHMLNGGTNPIGAVTWPSFADHLPDMITGSLDAQYRRPFSIKADYPGATVTDADPQGRFIPERMAEVMDSFKLPAEKRIGGNIMRALGRGSNPYVRHFNDKGYPNVDYMIAMGGTNDALNEVSTLGFASGYVNMLTEAHRSYGIRKAILIQPPPINAVMVGGGDGEQFPSVSDQTLAAADSYRNMFNVLESNILFDRVVERVTGMEITVLKLNNVQLIYDGLHMSPESHIQIATMLAELINSSRGSIVASR